MDVEVDIDVKGMEATLRVCAGGALIRRVWDGDARKFRVYDITNEMPQYLLYDCELASDVLLSDVFLLISKHIGVMNMLLGNWTSEWCHEILRPQKTRKPPLDYLELYWSINSDNELGTDGMLHTNFHGIENDQQYSISFLPAKDLATCPLKLSSQLHVYKDNKRVYEKGNNVAEFLRPGYKLLDILHGILWELSFYGSPKKCRQVKRSLDKQLEALGRGELELIPAEEVFGNLRDKLDAMPQNDAG